MADSHPVLAQLPPGSPCVRVTAGEGAAGEKCWNLTRCVTLIGSQRRAHIVLHEAAVAKAHCVIVNTGVDVLLMDLHTDDGTICNGRPITLVALRDGDVIDLGETRIDIAISGSPPPGPVQNRPAPTRLARTLHLSDVAVGTRWRVTQAVAMVGRSHHAEVSVPGADVEEAHAVIFRLGQGLAVFDLSGAGVGIDGELVSLAPIRDGQIVQVGSRRLRLGEPATRLPDPAVPVRIRRDQAAAGPGAAPSAPPRRNDSRTGPAAAATRPQAGANGAKGPSLDPIIRSLSDLEKDITALQSSISDSWKRLNPDAQRHEDPAAELTKSPADLLQRSRELDELEASLRGQLHDLTRCQEQLAEKERDLAAQAARIHEERLKFFQDQAAWAKRKAESARRAAELDRRERLLAEREGKLAAGEA